MESAGPVSGPGGWNQYGQVGNGTKGRQPEASAGGGLTWRHAIVQRGRDFHSLALKSDGTVWAWGQNNDGELGDGTKTNRSTPVKVSALSGVVDIGNGRLHSLAIESDGSVWAWGLNSTGQLGDGTKTNRATPIKVPGLTGAFGLGGGVNYSVVTHSLAANASERKLWRIVSAATSGAPDKAGAAGGRRIPWLCGSPR